MAQLELQDLPCFNDTSPPKTGKHPQIPSVSGPPRILSCVATLERPQTSQLVEAFFSPKASKTLETLKPQHAVQEALKHPKSAGSFEGGCFETKPEPSRP